MRATGNKEVSGSYSELTCFCLLQLAVYIILGLLCVFVIQMQDE